MIIEWLAKVGIGIASWVVTLFPEIELPEILVDLDDHINGLFAYGEGLGAFVAWPVIGAIAAIPLLAWAGGLLFKAVRALLAHIPLFGGKG